MNFKLKKIQNEVRETVRDQTDGHSYLGVNVYQHKCLLCIHYRNVGYISMTYSDIYHTLIFTSTERDAFEAFSLDLIHVLFHLIARVSVVQQGV